MLSKIRIRRTNNLLITLISLFLSVWVQMKVNAQGCSDAGICSLGISKSNVEDLQRNKISLGSGFGLGYRFTKTFNNYLDYQIKFSNQWTASTRLTSVFANGFLGNKFDWGDIYGSFKYTSTNKHNNSFNFIGGIKIPLTNSNDLNSSGEILPLDYQSSLGTYDILLGFNYFNKKGFEFELGGQIPIIQINKNAFSPAVFNDPRANRFLTTNQFKRKTDLLARIAYRWYVNHNLSIKPNLLLIYHIAEDDYFNSQPIIGSQGLTINGGLNLNTPLSKKENLEFIIASPFLSRKAHPDGTTRDLVLNLQYSFSW